MKKLILSLSLLVFSIQSADAQWWSSNKTVEGNGKYTTEKRSTSEYDQVSLQGSMDVELIAGTEGNLTVEAESNFHEFIITEVSHGTLKISVEDGMNLDPSKNYEIKITVPFKDLNSVFLTGSGDIYSSEKIKTEDFKVHVTGSGDLRLNLDARSVVGKLIGSGDLDLQGTTRDFECVVTGSGNLDASGLKAAQVSANVSGSGNIKVNASESLKSRVTGSGNISYSGNPQKQDFKTSGSGSISGK